MLETLAKANHLFQPLLQFIGVINRQDILSVYLDLKVLVIKAIDEYLMENVAQTKRTKLPVFC
jgi:hypothetical protein